MRKDYNECFFDLKKNVNKLNAVLVYEDELYAEFSLFDEWLLTFECEKYYGPSFTIGIKNKYHGDFAVWILMKVFSLLKGVDYGSLTIENQINFILNEKTSIFYNVHLYQEKYNEINNDI
jgi:hypothetical protein